MSQVSRTRMVAGVRHTVVTAACTAATLLNMVMPVLAGPTGGQVTAGSATIQQSGSKTTITAADRTIINFQSFNIGSGEAVQFVQPSATARVLNRVLDGHSTQIDGSLTANGRVYIINPAGIFFGNTAIVSGNQITAAAGNITDQNFLSGIDAFTGLSGSVVNAGRIQADSAVNLIGRQVANYGSIIAPNGMITMAAGDEVYLSTGSPLMVRVGDKSTATDQAAVNNTGTVDAGAKGKVFMGAADVYALGVRHTGEIRGRDVTISAPKAQVQVAGGLIGAWSDDDTGGSVKVLGKEVILAGNTKIDASGAKGGGTVNIGGSYQGNGPLPNADVVLVGKDVEVKADATVNGNGGTIIFWGNDANVFLGKASARGGLLGGDGGFVEVSSGNFLYTEGSRFDLTAPKGEFGTVLFDPQTIVIQPGTADSAQDFNVSGSTVVQTIDTLTVIGDSRINGTINYQDTGLTGLGATTWNVYESEIETNLLSTRVVLQARSTIRMGGASTAYGDSNGDGRPDIMLYPGDWLTLQTRNSTGSGDTAGNIDLRGTDGVPVDLIASNGGVITIEGSTSGGAASNIFVGRVSTNKNGAINIQTHNGTVTLLDTINASTTGAVMVESAGSMSISGNITAAAITLHSAATGVGTVTIAPGLTFAADNITLMAGDGTGGGGNGATFNAFSNSPQFRDSTSTTHPVNFTLVQDAAVNEGSLPLVSQFGSNINGMYYSIGSSDSTLSIADATRLGNAIVALSSSVSVTLNTTLSSSPALGIVAPLINLGADQTTTGPQGYYGTVVDTKTGTLTLTADSFDFTGDLIGNTTGRSLTIVSNGGDVTFRSAIGSAGTPLNNLNVTSAGNINFFGGSVLTTGSQHYFSPVLLRNDINFTSSSGSLTFDSGFAAKTVVAIPNTETTATHPDGTVFLFETNGVPASWHGQTSPPANPTVVFYDFRSENGQVNNISAAQMALAIEALNKWSDATNGQLVFVRSTTAPIASILNIGVGNFTATPAVGTVSLPADVLGYSPPTRTGNLLISSSRSWLDFAENWDLTIGNAATAISSSVDFSSVIIHELGHSLGLSHTTPLANGPYSVMDKYYTNSYENSTLSNVDIQLIQALYGVSNADRSVTLNAPGGNITLNGQAYTNNFTARAGGLITTKGVFASGNITLNSTNGTGRLLLTPSNGIALSSSGTITEGNLEPFTRVTLSGAILAPTIITNSPMRLAGASTLAANQAATISGTINAQGNNLTLLSDNINFSGITNSVSGGVLTLGPSTIGNTIGLNSTNAAFNLTSAQMAAISPNFTGIQVGNPAGVGAVSIGYSGPVDLSSKNNYHLGVFGGAVTFYNGITLGNNSSFSLVSNVGGVTGSGGTDVTVGGANGLADLTFAGPLTLKTSVANIGIHKTGTGNVSLVNNSAFGTALVNSSLSAGNITITNTGSGNITDNGTLSLPVGSVATFTNLAPGGNIVLDQLSLNGSISVNTTGGGNATLVSTGALILDTSVVSGNLSTTVNTGSITQNGPLTVGGAATFSAPNGSITLANADNDFTSISAAANPTTGDVTINDVNALTLAAGTTGRNVTVTAGGDILLNQQAITATGNVDLSTTGGKIDATTASSATASLAEITVGGDLSLAGNGIGVSNIIDVNGGSAAAGALTLNNTGTSGESVKLNILSNQFKSIDLTVADAASSTAITLPGGDGITITGGSDSTFTQLTLTANPIDFIYDLTALNAGIIIGAANVGAGAVTLYTNDGDISQTGPMTLGGHLTLSSGLGDIDLSNSSNQLTDVNVLTAGNVGIFNNANLTVLGIDALGTVEVAAAGNLAVDGVIDTFGSVTLAADNNVTFSATSSVTGAGVFVFADNNNNGSGGITMANGALINGTTGNVTLDAYDDITFTGLKTASVGGMVRVNSMNGALIDAGESRLDIDAPNTYATLLAINGIGAANPLEVNTRDVSAVNGYNSATLTPGDINLASPGALNIYHLLTLGNVIVNARTGIGISDDPTPVVGPMIQGNNMYLTAGGDIGALANPITIQIPGVINATGANVYLSQTGAARIGLIKASGGTIVFTGDDVVNSVTDNEFPDFWANNVTINAASIGETSRVDILAFRNFNATTTLGGVHVDFFLVIPPGSITVPNGQVADTTLSFVTNLSTALPENVPLNTAVASEGNINPLSTAIIADASGDSGRMLEHRPAHTVTSPAQFGVTSISTIERLGGATPGQFRSSLINSIQSYENAKKGSLVASSGLDPASYVAYLQFGSRTDSDLVRQDRSVVLSALRDINQQFHLMGLDGPQHEAQRITILRSVLPTGVDPVRFNEAVHLASPSPRPVALVP